MGGPLPNVSETSVPFAEPTNTAQFGRGHFTVPMLVPRPGDPLKVTMKVAGKVVAEGTVPISAPLAFTANDCLDIGIALGSPVSLDYYEKAPFKFNGTIERVHVRYAVPE